jgi:hypothetical protein
MSLGCTALLASQDLKCTLKEEFSGRALGCQMSSKSSLIDALRIVLFCHPLARSFSFRLQFVTALSASCLIQGRSKPLWGHLAIYAVR